jgi:hypothetical protein
LFVDHWLKVRQALTPAALFAQMAGGNVDADRGDGIAALFGPMLALEIALMRRISPIGVFVFASRIRLLGWIVRLLLRCSGLLA